MYPRHQAGCIDQLTQHSKKLTPLQASPPAVVMFRHSRSPRSKYSGFRTRKDAVHCITTQGNAGQNRGPKSHFLAVGPGLRAK